MSQDFPFEHFLKTTTKSINSNTNQALSPSFKNHLSQTTDLIATENNQKIDADFQADELDLLNTEILNFLRSAINPQKFGAYFKNTFFLSNISDNIAQFIVTTPFIKNMIETHYLDHISDAIRSTLGQHYTIELFVSETNRKPNSNSKNNYNSFQKEKPTSLSDLINESPERPTIRSSSEVSFKLDLNPTHDDLVSKVESQYIDHMNPEQTGILIDTKKTFDNFIVGPSNQLAFATAIAVADAPGKSGKYPCLYIHSDSGLGKTHLLHAVANQIKDKYPELAVCLITARDFMKEMINAIQLKKLPEFQKKYSETIDILMIDDIHELKNKQGTQNEFFHIFNELHNRGKQLIFTSDKAPKEIDGIEERVKTRLQWGLVIDIQRPDLETRIAILKRKAYELDLFLPDDVLNMIASSVKSSIRELEGSLIKLQAFADVMNVEIDTVMVKDLLNLQAGEEDSFVSLESIAKATSQYFKIPLADLKSKARGKDIVKARHVAMYLSKKILDATLKEIAKFYGGRDHSSVIHGVNKISDQLKSDLGLSKDVIYIENNL